jgi:hypothetical protein
MQTDCAARSRRAAAGLLGGSSQPVKLRRVMSVSAGLRAGPPDPFILSMQSGNGIDLAAVYQLLQDVARRVGAIEARLDTHETKLNELVSVANDHSGRFDRLDAVVNEHSRKIDNLNAGVAELSTAVSNYHDAAVGHGIWIGEINGRLDRIERSLGLEPVATA